MRVRSMSMRIRAARFLIQFGKLIESLPVVILKPDDLVAYSWQAYAEPEDVESWASDEVVDAGLNKDELELLNGLPHQSGALLLLGVGGGREAIPLAERGFAVTGVDYIPEMVERSIENASCRGVKINGLVQEMSKLDVPNEAYDVVWLSRAMYSCVPTRKRRVEMVRHIAAALKPGGMFICQFHWDPRLKLSRIGLLVRRILAIVTLGNWEYEEGDILWLNVEFIHSFTSEERIRSELQEGGFFIKSLETGKTPLRGSAVCRKSPQV